MSTLNNDSLLLGLSFLEATAKRDADMTKMINDSFSQDEIIKGLTMVAMAMTTLSASNEKYAGSSMLDMIEMARQTVIIKTRS